MAGADDATSRTAGPGRGARRARTRRRRLNRSALRPRDRRPQARVNVARGNGRKLACLGPRQMLRGSTYLTARSGLRRTAVLRCVVGAWRHRGAGRRQSELRRWSYQYDRCVRAICAGRCIIGVSDGGITIHTSPSAEAGSTDERCAAGCRRAAFFAHPEHSSRNFRRNTGRTGRSTCAVA